MKSIHVVAAVIYSADKDSILIAKRPSHLHQGGLWEFPGGKLEESESPLEALTRELKEELDITIGLAQSLLTISHDYPDKSVFLDVWEVFDFTGVARGAEGQEIRWADLKALSEYQFPEANLPIIDRLSTTTR